MEEQKQRARESRKEGAGTGSWKGEPKGSGWKGEDRKGSRKGEPEGKARKGIRRGTKGRKDVTEGDAGRRRNRRELEGKRGQGNG